MLMLALEVLRFPRQLIDMELVAHVVLVWTAHIEFKFSVCSISIKASKLELTNLYTSFPDQCMGLPALALATNGVT
jgi:hypothetical protein